MATQKRQAKGPQRDEDGTPSRQPAWRGQAPTHPRKRVKRRQQLTVPSGPGKDSGRGTSPSRGIDLPSKTTWLAALRIAVLLLTAIGATIGLIYLLRWPELAVSRSSTQIGGNLRITREEIYTGSGIDGRNILLVRGADVAAQVQELPGVARATVHVRLPNQVIIDIQEHAPLVAWQGITNTLWLAADGAEVPQAGVKPPVTFSDRSNGRLSRDMALRKLVLENLVAVHAVRPGLAEFFYADEPGLYYRSPEGWDVWLGESGPIDVKLALADAAGQDIARQGARPKVIDVRQSERKAMWW